MAGGNYFFALWPDRQTRLELREVAVAEPLKNTRIQHIEDLHLTLVFMGRLDTTTLDCVIGVGDCIQSQKFELKLEHSGYWPRPKIYWCAPYETDPLLAGLVGQLQTGLMACSIQPENRRYKPHVTLLRKYTGKHAQRLDQPIEWTVSGFVLATSGPSQPGAPRYKIVKTWSLNDG